MSSPLSILKKYWHYDHFRPQQEEIIHHVLGQKDTLAILPTGGGKSVCYQVPALMLDGACLVISPLIALMKDQLLGLEQKGIPALVVYSGMRTEELESIYRKMSSGEIKFLFVSPERLQTTMFLDYLLDWNIKLIAVDEAHCISQWGYDFRPAYLDIAQLRLILNNVPILALTASATPMVQQDIIEKLAFKNHQTFFTSFARTNISFSCFNVESKMVKAVDILQKVKGSSIVYCRNRKRTKEVSESLNAAGLKTDYYHAGLSQEIRSTKQDDWIENKTTTMVCTNAFGMGIDKPDVRCVIHYDLPDTPEAYYQEAGRAGRDGSKAYTVLLYQDIDLMELKNGIELKYPSASKIKEIYESIAYYLQVGIGYGLETMYDFEVVDFCKKFKFNVIEVLSAIKLLEQQAYWQMTESVYLPSRLSVIATKEEVESIEHLHPELDEILKQVLRLYGGIWHHYMPIRELHIAQETRVSSDYVALILRKLNALQIVDYIEAKEKPQLFYLHNRLPKNEVQLDTALMNLLKTRYREHVTFMIDYATLDNTCRSNKLISYFKETMTKDCGLCDICLKKKSGSMTSVDYLSIKNTLLNELALSETINIGLFCKRYSSLQQEKLMKIIRFLLDENAISLNGDGELILKK